MPTNQIVNWNTYAQTYDMLLSYNPFYQQLHQEVMEHVSHWDIQSDDLLADVGAGTGNYSIALAQQFPQASVLHIDRDEGMNAVTAEKKSQAQLSNHQTLPFGIHEVNLEDESLKGLISIHALYTFPNPKRVIRDMYRWLEPGGYAVLVDAGRMLNILDWQVAIGWQLLRRYGFKKTVEVLKEGKEVSQQNAYIRDMQKKGTFWTHSHEEFCEAVEAAGFTLTHNTPTFRGYSDLVVVRKV